MEVVESAPEPEDVILWKYKESSQSPVFGPELDNHQRIDLLGHLEEFTGVLQDKPGERCLRSIALRQEQLAQCVNIPIEYPMGTRT